MAVRRIIYIALLALAALYHFAYGQYATHYILIFFLCLPVLSLLVSLPAALTSRAALVGGLDVHRNMEGGVLLELECRSFLPPELWQVTVEEKNLFTGTAGAPQIIKAGGTKKLTKSFHPDTTRLGTIRYSIKKARIYDYLGLFAIPVKRSGSAEFTVLPDIERPNPEPELDDPSSLYFKPKPLGFSEEHELRQYRGGDPLNLIHWKLSGKMDELIVREPQEIIRKRIVLSVDIPADYPAQQSVIEQLRYLSEELIEKEIPYQLVFGVDKRNITSNDEFNEFIKQKLSEPLRAKYALGETLIGDTLIYRIRPSKGVSA
ncbi:MAG: DUF58 domain-containing protein [Clostridia bacterium]|nr:DUF58 domain-containing protein [Clostridia bacterium]